jgi:hypothetical protein
MKTVNEKTIRTALNRAIRNITSNQNVTSAASSAGFIITDGQKRGQKTGFQVFVKICRYSDVRLKKYPNSGGLAAGCP